MAIAFSRLDLSEFIQIDVYESTAKLTQVGAGITLWPRGWEILQDMGVEESLAKRFAPGQELPRRDVPSMLRCFFLS